MIGADGCTFVGQPAHVARCRAEHAHISSALERDFAASTVPAHVAADAYAVMEARAGWVEAIDSEWRE